MRWSKFGAFDSKKGLKTYFLSDNPQPPFMTNARLYLPLLLSSSPSQLTMDLILSQNINSELMPNACSMLYVLICCYQVKYTSAK